MVWTSKEEESVRLLEQKMDWRQVRIARFRLGERGGLKGREYWKERKKRLCPMCESEMETWEHIWEECGS